MQRKRRVGKYHHHLANGGKIEQVRQNDPTTTGMLGLDLNLPCSDGMKPFSKPTRCSLIARKYDRWTRVLVYNAVRDGLVDAGLVYTTDGRVKRV